VQISISIYAFILQARHFIHCKYSATDTTLTKMADLPAEASTGVLQNFLRVSEYSTALETVHCESEFTGSKLREDGRHTDFLRFMITE